MRTFHSFIDLVEKTKNRQLLEDFLLALTSPYEQKIIARRIEIIDRLIAGQHHYQIARELKVGVATVTRGARELSRGHFKILINKTRR